MTPDALIRRELTNASESRRIIKLQTRLHDKFCTPLRPPPLGGARLERPGASVSRTAEGGLMWPAPSWWTRPIAPTTLTGFQLATSLLAPSPRRVRFAALRSFLRWRPLPSRAR